MLGTGGKESGWLAPIRGNACHGRSTRARTDNKEVLEMTWLRNLRLIVAAALVVLALGGGIASSALATGQPGAAAGNICGEGTAAETPGEAASAAQT